MKVLLIIPTANYAFEYPSFMPLSDFPVGFAYIAAALEEAGHTVLGLNPNNDTHYKTSYEMLSDKLLHALKTNPPDLIGIGGLVIDFIFLKDCVNILRKNVPHIPIVLGGGIVSNDSEYVFQRLKPDFCVIGQGEETITRLAKILEQRGTNFEDIDNLGYWDKSVPKFTKRNFSFRDLDTIPFPNYEPFGVRDLLDNYSPATRMGFRYTRLDPRPMSIVTARGCPFSCTFCVHQKMRGYRSRSIENIMREIQLHYEKYHFNILLIMDELFAINKQRVHEFVNAVMEGKKKYGWDFDWLFQTHASASLDEQTLIAAKQAGLFMFSYGLESASPTIITSMNKKTKQPQIIDAIKIADKVKIGFGGNFIFGDVAESNTTICETLDFFSTYCRDIQINLFHIQPYPGSKIFDHCLEKGIIKNKNAFYDSGSAIVYNMTTLPDYIWFPWQRELLHLASANGWCRVTKATTIEKEEKQNPIARYYGQQVYTVKTICPYCGSGSSYQEMLSLDSSPKINILDVFRRTLKKLLAFTRVGALLPLLYQLFLWFFLSPISSIINPAFKKLGYLRSNKTTNASFITVCTNCHKRIRVVLPNVKN